MTAVPGFVCTKCSETGMSKSIFPVANIELLVAKSNFEVTALLESKIPLIYIVSEFTEYSLKFCEYARVLLFFLNAVS